VDDQILLEGIEVPAALGVSKAERAMRRPALIDVALSLDLRRAGRRDRLADTIDYAEIYTAVEEVARGEHRLVEALAERLAAHLLASFPIRSCTVTVRKPSPVAGTLKYAGVRITREQARG
jgi:dihydroneopterin aldolase